MPILAYFAVVGAALLALLFVADAKFERHGPLAISSNFEGLPKPWKPEINPPLPQAKPAEIQTAAAPALDPKWNGDKPAAVAAVPPPAAPARQIAKAEPVPKKQKHAARKAPKRYEDAQRYAWRHDGGGWFGGNSNPWRF